MSFGLGNWIIGLCAGAAFCSVCLAMLGKKRSAAVKLVCGLVMLWLIASPILNIGKLRDGLAQGSKFTEAAEDYAASAEQTRRSLESAVIKDGAREYILSKAEALGVGGAWAEVELNETETGAYPYALRLGGEGTEEAKRKLTKCIEEELGIPAERQYWSDEND